MKTTLLHSYGKQDIEEYEYVLPDIEPNQALIRTIMTGVCRSDIGVFSGQEKPMPLGQFGHEGLGEIVELGEELMDLDEGPKLGDIVATFSDPAYSDYYYAKANELVIVPEAHPKYILQPVACALNIMYETINYAMRIGIRKTPILILGSGFLTSICAMMSKQINIPPIEVVGRSNTALLDKLEIKRFNSIEEVQNKYKVVIDLSSKAENFDKAISLLEDSGLLCYAATPTDPVKTNFFEACWKATTIILPSPRSKGFIGCMNEAKKLIENGKIDVSTLWTAGYDRKTEYKKAFTDGMNRPRGYVRGYIQWKPTQENG